MAGHVLRLWKAEQGEQRRRDIGEDTVFDPKLGRVLGHVDQMHEVRRVRGVRRTVRVSHQLAVAVVSRDQAGAAEFCCNSGILADVAPTLLFMLGLPQPAEMTGKNLLVRKS